MAGLNLTFSIEGEVQFSRTLMVAAEGIKHFDKPLEAIGKELLSSFQLNFDVRGGLFGSWQPAAKDYGHPLLEDTGTMRGNFGSVVEQNQVTLFNTTPYFPYHQSNQARSKLPRRVMMLIDNERRTFIVKSFQNYIRELVGLYRV